MNKLNFGVLLIFIGALIIIFFPFVAIISIPNIIVGMYFVYKGDVNQDKENKNDVNQDNKFKWMKWDRGDKIVLSMFIILIFIFLTLPILYSFGAWIKPQVDTAIQNVAMEGNLIKREVEMNCQPPNVVIGLSCCLDENKNNFCDNLELCKPNYVRSIMYQPMVIGMIDCKTACYKEYEVTSFKVEEVELNEYTTTEQCFCDINDCNP